MSDCRHTDYPVKVVVDSAAFYYDGNVRIEKVGQTRSCPNCGHIYGQDHNAPS